MNEKSETVGEKLRVEKPVAKKEKKKRNVKKTVNTIINVVLIVAIIVAAICTYISFVNTSGTGVPNILGLRLLSIQTDSMYPTIKAGDLVIDVGVGDASELRSGDVITYWTMINGEHVLNTHRIVAIYDGGEHLIFETKGDANSTADPMTVHENKIVGKYKFRIPGVGKAIDYLQTSTGFLLVVLIPVFIFFIFHLVQFFRVLFEYQNVKNRIKYEQERGKTEDLIAAQKAAEVKKEVERAQMEAELRETLRAELLESMKQEQAAKAAEKAPEEPVKEAAEETAEEPAKEAAEEKAEEPVKDTAEEKTEASAGEQEA